MIKRIVIENFKSFKKVDLELGRVNLFKRHSWKSPPIAGRALAKSIDNRPDSGDGDNPFGFGFGLAEAG